MKELPILYSTPMVQAILEGRKTQTRRVIKFPWASALGEWEPLWMTPDGLHDSKGTPATFAPHWVMWHTRNGKVVGPKYQVGDHLWVKTAANAFPVYCKPIIGYEGIYGAGTDGNIYRMDGGEPRVLKGCQSTKGYLIVSLSRNGEVATALVHQLIGRTFYGESPFSDAQIRHMDGNQLDNRPQNLDWGSQEDNWVDRKAHGRGMGEAHHAAKLTEIAVADIRTSALSQRQLARKYDVCQAAIWAAKHSVSWSPSYPEPTRNLLMWDFWQTSRFMPKWAARLWLEVTEVRAQRLQEITEVECLLEGVTDIGQGVGTYDGKYGMSTTLFMCLWDSINGKTHPWSNNDWVWAYTFKRIEH